MSLYAYRAFIQHNQIQDVLNEKTSKVDIRNYDELTATSREMQELVRNGQIPADLEKDDIMPQCIKCGKKGLFLKIEDDTGLCLSCNGSFAQEGKVLTQKITEAKNKAVIAKDPGEIAASCKEVEQYGNELTALHQAYNLQPSQILLDLIETCKKKRELAEK